MRPTIQARTELYADSNARNWLAINNCEITPTKLGGLEIVFNSERTKLDFCLRYSQYAIHILSDTHGN